MIEVKKILRRFFRGNGGTSPDDSHRKLAALCDPDTIRKVEARHQQIDQALDRGLRPHQGAAVPSGHVGR